MATTPLFVASQAELKTQLRLEFSDNNSGAAALFNQCVLHARLEMVRRLTLARVQTLQATAFVEDPTTDAQYLRAIANQTEMLMVKCHALKSFRVAFMDASGDAKLRWNDEALTREIGSDEGLEMQLQCCRDQIEANIASLDGGSLGKERRSQVFDGSPECKAPKVGDSVKNIAVWRPSNDE